MLISLFPKLCCMCLTCGKAQIPMKQAGGQAKSFARSQSDCVKEVALSYNFIQNNKFQSVFLIYLDKKDAAKTGPLFRQVLGN